MPAVKHNLKAELNRMNPTADHAKLGDVIDELMPSTTPCASSIDADAGVSDTNYTATLGVTALGNRTFPL